MNSLNKKHQKASQEAATGRFNPDAVLQRALLAASMHIEEMQDGDSADRVCPNCESAQVITRWEVQAFDAGDSSTDATVEARVPVRHCSTCGFDFLDKEAERARHAALCASRGLMTPDEIRALRMSLNVNREEFSQVTGIGVASIARWESGSQIQSRALDKYMRLLRGLESLAPLERLDTPLSERSFRRAPLTIRRPRALVNAEMVRTTGRSFSPRPSRLRLTR